MTQQELNSSVIAGLQKDNPNFMANPFFQFKQFIVYHDRCAMKVTTDACLFGAWCAEELRKQNLQNDTAILDIGAGTGLLALMIAQKNRAMIDAVEIEAEAAAQASENVSKSLWRDQIFVHQKDVLQFGGEKKYDVIISNPPFYEMEIKSASAEKNTAHHSHALRLEDLLSFVKQHLTKDGKFFLLLPYKRITEIKSLFKKFALYIEQEVTVRQSVYHKPFRVMIKGSLNAVQTAGSEITIRNSEDQYTDEFVQLLKDYYLYL